jgi:hypothetical protein
VTLVTLRPSSTTSNTGTLTSGATAHAVTSDNSDASYDSLANGQLAAMGLDNLSLPTGAMLAQLDIRVRVAMASGFANLTALLRDSSGLASLTATLGVGGSTIYTFSYVGALGTSLGGFSDPRIDDATLTLTNSGGNGAPGTIRVHEAYVDVAYAVQPVVVVNAPTGTITATNRPAVSWTNTLDSAGGPQALYQLKVFSAAQYGAAGFDPELSAATYDPGGSFGQATVGQVLDALPDATYRLYVKVAQVINGAPHWSAWASSGFVLDVDPPGTPTLVATADNANGRVAVAVTDNPAVAVPTEGFELQRSLDGVTWENVRTADVAGALDVPWVVDPSMIGIATTVGDATSYSIDYPTPGGVTDGILPGDVFIAFVGLDGNPTVTWPTGWTEIKDEAGNGSAVRAAVAWKRAIGNEAGTQFTITLSASEGGQARVLCVRGAHPTTAPEVSTGVSGSGANADPDSCNPSGWGTENTLWIAAMANDGNVAVTAGPAGYSTFGNTRWANANGAGISTATRMAVLASEDPGAFTHAAEDTRAFTVAVRPRNANLTVYDYEAPNGVTVMYRARALHNYGGVQAASVWATDSEAWTSSACWLKHPNHPALNTAVELMAYGPVTRAVRQGSFQPLGADCRIVISDTRGDDSGATMIRTRTNAAKDALKALIDAGGTLLLQAPLVAGEPDRYIRVGDHQVGRTVETQTIAIREHSLPWVRVARPDGATS